MKRGEVLGKAIFDFSTYFTPAEVGEYKKTITEFIRANENLSDEEFYDKFEKQFAMVRVLEPAFARNSLAKISSSVNTIKIIAIIYLVASIIGALYVLGS